jgi:hypothetical protein
MRKKMSEKELKFPSNFYELPRFKPMTNRQRIILRGVQTLLDKVHIGNATTEERLRTIRIMTRRVKFKLIANNPRPLRRDRVVKLRMVRGGLHRDPNQPVAQLR